MRNNLTRHNRHSIRLKDYDYSSSGFYFLTLCTKDKIMLFGTIENNEMVLNEYGKIVQEEWIKSPEIRKEIELDEFIIMPNHIHGIVIIKTPDKIAPPLSPPNHSPVCDLYDNGQIISPGHIPVGAHGRAPLYKNAIYENPNAPIYENAHTPMENNHAPMYKTPGHITPPLSPPNHSPVCDVYDNGQIISPGHIPAGAHGRAPLRRKQKSISSFIAGFKSIVTKKINILRDMPAIPVWQRNYHDHIIRNDEELFSIRKYIIENPLKWKNKIIEFNAETHGRVDGRGARPCAPTD